MKFLAFLLVLLSSALFSPQAAGRTVESLKFGKNAEIWLVEDHSLPLVAVNMIFARPPRLKSEPSAPVLLAKLLKGGNGEMSREEFAELLEESSIRLSFSGDEDLFTISVQAAAQEVEQAFRLLKAAWNDPAFAEDELRLAQAELKASFDGRRQNPPYLAARLWYENAFPNHPYGADPLADPRAVDGNQLREFIGELRRAPLFVGAAGDISPRRLGSLLSSVFPDATGGKLPPVSMVAPQKFFKTEPMELKQTAVYFGLAGLSPNDEDYVALALLNHIVGEGFGSRLVKTIREEKGLAYSVGSGLNSLAASPLIVGSLQTDKPEQAIELLEQQLAAVAKNGVSEPELADAKSYLAGSLPVRLIKLKEIADFLAFNQYLGRPKNYLQIRKRLIEAVTLEQINRLAAKIFSRSPSILVLGGKQQG